MESCCPTQAAIFQELDQIAPGAPLLALGQTVFWDEPMKVGVALCAQRLGSNRRFVAGVHDTDYFAKLPTAGQEEQYKALPHNDISTRGLWSAAGEFSALFGSETPITLKALQGAGVRTSRLEREEPGFLDKITEAWGWRGVVRIGESTKTSAETSLGPLYPALESTLEWATSESLRCIHGPTKQGSLNVAALLKSLVCDASEPRHKLSLAAFYRSLIPHLYGLAAGTQPQIEATTTSDLLCFNSETYGLPRFDLLKLFVEPTTREVARRAYNEAVGQGEIYPLDRFGSFALPFDLVIPGHGRGTLRLAPKGLIVMTHTPVFASFKKPVATLQQLAEVVEAKWGKECVLVGKAVTLIGMLAREFVFVFHEGGSPYVKLSIKFHQLLAEAGQPLQLNPILRVRYSPWDALREVPVELNLPEPLRDPFQAETLEGKSFAARWHEVVQEQELLLSQLAQQKRTITFLQSLAQKDPQRWATLSEEYAAIEALLERLWGAVGGVKAEKKLLLEDLNRWKQERVKTEIQKGQHWRAKMFEKKPKPEDEEERERFTEHVNHCISQITALRKQWAKLEAKQRSLVTSTEIMKAHARRRSIELEVEKEKAIWVRNAITASIGLKKAGYRPSAWWFPLVSPDGKWFRETIRHANYYLERLI